MSLGPAGLPHAEWHAHGLALLAHRAASSCSASVFSLDASQVPEDNETDTGSIGYAPSPSRPLQNKTNRGGGHAGGALGRRSAARGGAASGAVSLRPKQQGPGGGVAVDGDGQRGGDEGSEFVPLDDESVEGAAARIFGIPLASRRQRGRVQEVPEDPGRG